MHLLSALALAAALGAEPRPSDRRAWLACAKDEDCAVVELGCWYWQPVNAAHAREMKDAYPAACLASAPAGPRPGARCVAGACELAPYTVGYWERLERESEWSIQNVLMAKRVEDCLRATQLSMSSESRMLWRDRFTRAVDKRIEDKRVGETLPLDSVVEEAAPCRPLAAWQEEQERNRAAERAGGSDVRVRVDNVPEGYSLDGIYPALRAYGKTYRRCGQESTRPGARFWGAMRATFAIAADGSVEPGSLMASYPAVAHMRRFADCAGGAFKALRFAKPESGPVAVEASIELPFKP